VTHCLGACLGRACPDPGLNTSHLPAGLWLSQDHPNGGRGYLHVTGDHLVQACQAGAWGGCLPMGPPAMVP